MIIVDETLVGTWFIAFDHHDVMAGLSSVEGGYQMTWRVRYHSRPESHALEFKDRKIWHQSSILAASEQHCIRRVRLWMAQLQTIGGGEVVETLRAGRTIPEFAQAIATMTGASTMELTAEEYRAQFGEPPEFKK